MENNNTTNTLDTKLDDFINPIVATNPTIIDHLDEWRYMPSYKLQECWNYIKGLFIDLDKSNKKKMIRKYTRQVLKTYQQYYNPLSSSSISTNDEGFRIRDHYKMKYNLDTSRIKKIWETNKQEQ